jgi:hypothetical protein
MEDGGLAVVGFGLRELEERVQGDSRRLEGNGMEVGEP